jgi:hypothetical protein
MCNNGADALQTISTDALRKQCSDPDNTPNIAANNTPNQDNETVFENSSLD